MSPISSEEAIVRLFTPMPPGYIFVPKGNVYVTKNCRKLTEAQNKPVYTVLSDRRTTLGIRVPNSIYAKVLADDKITAATRAENVKRKDQSLEDKTEAEVLTCFPGIPAEHVPRILKHTLQKRSRRVGRSREMPRRQVVDLAVRAYIRHKLTDYDMMLRKGVDREQARKRIQDSVDEKVLQWGGAIRYGKVRKQNGKWNKESHRSSKRFSSSSRANSANAGTFAKRHSSNSHNSNPVRAGAAKKNPTLTMPKSAWQYQSGPPDKSLTFRSRPTSLRNRDGQIPDERIIIVISDDEDFVDDDDDDMDIGDLDASYQDGSDLE